MIEESRSTLQSQLDGRKSLVERNRLGQFATPPGLAEEILRYGVSLLPGRRAIRFLDPAVGTGAFFSALRTVVPGKRIAAAVGFEVDPHYGEPSAALWRGCGFDYRIEDFTQAAAASRFNLLICNPPYVRHHHLAGDAKIRLQQRTRAASGMSLGGLSGLYCHFVGLSHAWLEDGGVAGWLVPSEFMDVNYGRVLKQYLLDKVTLLHVHRFDPGDVQFADALVSSAIVWLRNSAPKEHAVRFTFGGSLAKPKVARSVAVGDLARETKWTRFPVADVRRSSAVAAIGDFFRIKRGLATGDNSYFILSLEQILARGLPLEAFRPILPSPRYLTTDIVDGDGDGRPQLERQRFLLDTGLENEEIAERFPALFAYLQEGRARGLHERYLCRHRNPWYAQEKRPAAPVVCTYLGRVSASRKCPFRFILNRSMATAANVYLLMYPTPPLERALARDPTLIDRVWRALNRITTRELVAEGRVYGGGLHKLEPKELANVPAPEVAELILGRPACGTRANVLAGLSESGVPVRP